MNFKAKFKMPNISKREKFLFLTVFILFICAVLFSLVKTHLIESVFEINRQIEEKESILLSYSASDKDYTSSSQGKKSRQSLELEVIEKVRLLCNEHKLVIQSIKPLKSKAKKTRYKQLLLEVVVDGSLGSLVKFLNKLENWSLAVSLKAVQVSSQRSAKNNGLRLKLILRRIYF